MRVIWKVAVGLAFFLTASPPLLSAQDYRAQALRILKTVPLIDGHNDIPDAIRERGGLDSVDFAVSQPKLMTDIPKLRAGAVGGDRKSTRLNSSHTVISYAVFCLKKKRNTSSRTASVVDSYGS